MLDISAKRFAEFHKNFEGGVWWLICSKCGGKCEKHKIGPLMPGEARYISGQLGQKPFEFKARYLDCLRTPFGNVDVLKLKPDCPFLNLGSRCALGLAKVKVISCETYPIVFKVEEKKLRFFLDLECPLSRDPEAKDYFGRVGIPALIKLGAPLKWYRIFEQFDSLNIDYGKLGYMRKSGYETFDLEDISRSVITCTCKPRNIPPESDTSWTCRECGRQYCERCNENCPFCGRWNDSPGAGLARGFPLPGFMKK